ncbi:MAG TPA: hypothetical protein VJR89_10120 [Polyangiales bacterium]|nr:hypothetical protein [Polyangiales bacterium]
MPLPAAGTSAAAGGPAPVTCVRPPGCDHISTPFFTGTACCTEKTPCGYELPELDPETEMWFPNARAQLEMVTKDDPNHKCAPEWWFFGPRPGVNSQRYEQAGFDDILVAEECPSYTVLPHILPGCCMPDNTCGLSTNESWPTFEEFEGPGAAPFTNPECVSAEELNRQFRASRHLTTFARTVAAGSCNYAALDAMFPNYY